MSLHEEAMNIKSSLDQAELENFKKFEGWLDKSKWIHGTREIERLIVM